jgi:hypothetical protein
LGRENSELLHEANRVHDDATFRDLAIAVVVDRPCLDGDPTASGSYPEERCLVRSLPGGSGGHLGAFGYFFLDPPMC